MSRAASAAASLPLRNSNFCRTTTDGRAVIVSASFDELGEKRYAQPGGEARGFRLLGQRAGRAGLDAAQATLAVAVIHAGELALEPAAFLAVFPDQAEIGAHQVAQPAVDAPLPVENRQRSGARCRKVVPHRVARLGDDCADRLRLIAPRRLGPGGRQIALGSAHAPERLELRGPAPERALVGSDRLRPLARKPLGQGLEDLFGVEKRQRGAKRPEQDRVGPGFLLHRNPESVDANDPHRARQRRELFRDRARRRVVDECAVLAQPGKGRRIAQKRGVENRGGNGAYARVRWYGSAGPRAPGARTSARASPSSRTRTRKNGRRSAPSSAPRRSPAPARPRERPGPRSIRTGSRKTGRPSAAIPSRSPVVPRAQCTGGVGTGVY